MKKRFIAGALALLTTFSFCACGSDKEIKNIFSKNDNASKYVTLGEYKGIEVNLDNNYDVNDEAVKDYINSLIAYQGIYEKGDETEVKADSIVNVDYTGYQDNQPFQGGSATNQNVNIVSNNYIDGFAEALIGHSVGETFREDVTFPEDYGNEELAGQTVQFEYTINYICKSVDASNITDEIVKEYFQMDSVDELREQTRMYLTESNESQKTSDARQVIMSKLIESSTVDLPEKEVEERTQEYIDKYVEAYVSDGTTLDEYLKLYSISYDDFYLEQKTGVEEDLTLELICQAIAEQENITIDEADFSSYLEYFLQNSNFASESELYKAYGKDEQSGKEYFRTMFLCNQALSFVVDNAVINTK